ncbi:hypothetical protein MUN78_10160 [Leucobacter allii]|uniref:Minor tail protein n=1 Tax=Leucobacter allii TaxID=2932247 RepID=A0ABY4FJB8_9MICO|nr:hypothetical protein [Leucobacter allii]UOQ56067.1 hypothetical protein MUN78_10160 [Leucobacter allii]
MTDLATGSITYEGVSFQFGDGTPYRITTFKRGTATYRSQDRDREHGDGRDMGRDLKTAPTHELGLAVLGEGTTPAEREADVRRLLEELAVVWSADTLRSRNGAVAKLQIGGRYALGRPRDFVPEDDGLWDGISEPSLKFVASDDLWYGPSSILQFGLVPEYTGGLPVAAAVPFVLGGGTGTGNRTITVEGTKPSWPVFTLHGPIKDPYIEVVGVGRLVFSCTLAYDQHLTVDCRPPRGITRNGAPLPGALSPSGDRLSDMELRPGSYSVLFGGYDPSGTSAISVEVAPAYPNF